MTSELDHLRQETDFDPEARPNRPVKLPVRTLYSLKEFRAIAKEIERQADE